MSPCMKFRLGARALNNEYNKSTIAVDIVTTERSLCSHENAENAI